MLSASTHQHTIGFFAIMDVQEDYSIWLSVFEDSFLLLNPFKANEHPAGVRRGGTSILNKWTTKVKHSGASALWVCAVETAGLLLVDSPLGRIFWERENMLALRPAECKQHDT